MFKKFHISKFPGLKAKGFKVLLIKETDRTLSHKPHKILT